MLSKGLAVAVILLFLGLVITPLTQSINSKVSNPEPSIEIINPKKGYLHISGIPLMPTPSVFNVDTVLFGGFRLRPIQVKITDEQNDNITVLLRINGEVKGYSTWNDETGYAEWYWTGLAIGPYLLEFRVMDEFNYWSEWIALGLLNFCIFP